MALIAFASDSGSVGSGDTYESFTWPKGVDIIDTEGEGVIRYPYDGMVRHKHYIAQAETATGDDHFQGMITANYTISRSGKVFIADIRHEVPQPRRCGNSIVNRLTSMNGQTV